MSSKLMKPGLQSLFPLVSSREIADDFSKRAEILADKLDGMINRLSHPGELEADYLIVMGIRLLQDMLRSDETHTYLFVLDAMRQLGKDYQSEVLAADKMHSEETLFQKQVVSFMAKRFRVMNPHMTSDLDDLTTVGLSLIFTQADTQRDNDFNYLRQSFKNQKYLEKFGLARLCQVKRYNEWLETAECARAVRVYMHLQSYASETGRVVPQPKRLALHG